MGNGSRQEPEILQLLVNVLNMSIRNGMVLLCRHRQSINGYLVVVTE